MFTIDHTALAHQEVLEREAERELPTNLVIVVVDDVGTDLLAAYEPFYPDHPAEVSSARTPVIDTLASEGLLFTNAWAAATCSPSRAQILTGRYSQRTGIGTAVKYLDASVPPIQPGLQFGERLLPQILALAPESFATAAVGKWHLADPSQPITHALGSPAGKWFDRYAGSLHNLNMPGPGYNDWEKTFATPVDPSRDEIEAPGQTRLAVLPDSPRNYATADTADDAIYLVQELEEPWFLFLAFSSAHRPLGAPDLPLTPPECFSDAPVSCDADEGSTAERTRCMVETLDAELGRLLCALQDPALGPVRPVTLILIGDNGTESEAIVPPFEPAHGKGSLYQGGINVPLIVRGPGVVPGVCHQLVSSTDIFATAAELAGFPEPGELTEDSVSFVPYLVGETETPLREFVYQEKFRPNFVPAQNGLPPKGFVADYHWRTARNERYKLIVRHESAGDGTLRIEEEIYDLSTPLDEGFADVFERRNLFDSFTPGDGSELDASYRELEAALLPALPTS